MCSQRDSITSSLLEDSDNSIAIARPVRDSEQKSMALQRRTWNCQNGSDDNISCNILSSVSMNIAVPDYTSMQGNARISTQ